MEWNMSKISWAIFTVLVFFLILDSPSLQNAISTTIKTNLTDFNYTTISPKLSSNQTTAFVNSWTTMPVTTCKTNDSCSFNSNATNATTIPSSSQVTTVAPANMDTNGSTSSSSVRGSLIEKKDSSTISSKNICLCDLKVEYCDINCCCDRDCSTDDKSVFTQCEKDFHYYDTKFCHYMKHVYVNYTVHEMEVNQHGLFCVVRANLPPSYIIQKKSPVKSIHETEIYKMNRYSWPQIAEESVLQFSSEMYVYGKPLWIIRNDSMSYLRIPKNHITSNCLIKEDIQFLVDVRSSCIQEITAENRQLKAETYFTNVTIITNPKLFNISFYEKKNILKECPRNVCLSLEASLCKDNFDDCIPVSNSSLQKMSCHLSITNNEYSCLNLVRGIKYVLYHNASRGLIKAELFINQRNISYFLGDDVNFVQTFEVQFRWWNHSLNYSSYLSGNPGYITGKPILTAYLVQDTHVNSTNLNASNANSTNYSNETKLLRNPVDFRDNFLTLPDSDSDSFCILNKNEFVPIEFGFNTYSKCVLRERVLINKNLTAGNVCVKVQRTILNYWSLNVTNDTLANKLVGQFGNANVFNKNEWLSIMYKRDIGDVINATWGEFGLKNETIKCGNMTTLLRMEFYHSRVDFDDIINQEKILGATFEFSRFRNITLRYQPQEYVDLSVNIGTQVMFFDITSKKIRKLVDPPSLSIKLPHDFFYPFVKINNYCGKQHQVVSVYLLLFTIINVVILSQ